MELKLKMANGEKLLGMVYKAFAELLGFYQMQTSRLHWWKVMIPSSSSIYIT